MMNNLWWTQISGSRRIIDGIVHDIENRDNAIIVVPTGTPWPEDFRSILRAKLEMLFDTKSVHYVDTGNMNVGEYMLEHYCKKDIRFTYRPVISEGKFLGKCDDLTLGNAIIWVKNSRQRLAEWVSFITDYRNAIGDKEPALFILELESLPEAFLSKKYLAIHTIGQTIPEYVRYTFASILADEEEIKDNFVAYVSQLMTTCCSDIELIPICMGQWKRFISDPYKTVQDLYATMTRSNGTAFSMNEDEVAFDKKIWEAQIKILFPCIERYRTYILNKMHKQINSKITFPYHNGYEDVETIYELELKDLLFLIGTEKLTMSDSKEYNRLTCFKEYRNKLAHLSHVDWEEAKFILENYQG